MKLQELIIIITITIIALCFISIIPPVDWNNVIHHLQELFEGVL